METKMRGVTLVADWDPKPGFLLGAKDTDRRQTYLGSLVWRNPRIEIRDYDIPKPGPGEVLIQVKACVSVAVTFIWLSQTIMVTFFILG
jgi:hypothetical protein